MGRADVPAGSPDADTTVSVWRAGRLCRVCPVLERRRHAPCAGLPPAVCPLRQAHLWRERVAPHAGWSAGGEQHTDRRM